MPFSGRWLLAAAWLAAAGGFSTPSRGQATSPPPRTEAELAAARKVFASALRDEQEARFDVALDGFRRVREVRDTAPVEYRIGTCLEALGQLTEALSAYDAAIRLGDGDAAQADLVAESRERSDALSKRVAHLGSVASTPLPGTDEPRAPTDATSASSTWGWIGIGAGGALLAGSVVSFVLRESDIRTANRLCPGGGCVGSIDGEALSATNRARVEGPLGVGLGAGGLVATALGVYLVLRTPSRTTAVSLAPVTWRGGAGVELGGVL